MATGGRTDGLRACSGCAVIAVAVIIVAIIVVNKGLKPLVGWMGEVLRVHCGSRKIGLATRG